MRILFAYNNPIALPLAEWLAQQGNSVFCTSERMTVRTTRAYDVDLVVSYCFRYMISKDVIDSVSGNIINLHTSFLPWNRGSDPNFWSFWDDTPKGVTIHYIDEKLDRGRIIAQRQIALDPARESFVTSYEKLHETMRTLFQEIWPDYANWPARSFLAQGTGSYHSGADKREIIAGPIDWNENIQEFLNRQRHAATGTAHDPLPR